MVMVSTSFFCVLCFSVVKSTAMRFRFAIQPTRRYFFTCRCLILVLLLHTAYAQQERGVALVTEYGAIGNGQSDDSQAIQEAVDSGKGEIVFPAGTYRISKTIEVVLEKIGPISLTGRGTARIIMAGEGPAFRILGTHQGTAGPETVQSRVWQRERVPVVDGLEIVGDHPQASGVQLEGTMQATISRLVVREALHGIHLTKRNRNVIISDSHLYHNRGIGIFLDGVNLHQINIVGSHISYNQQGGIVVQRSEIRNLHIGTCDIEANMSEQYPGAANVFLDAREGSIREGAITGSTLQHSHFSDSANIRFLGPGPELNQKVGHFAIADNALSDVAVNVHLKNARGVTITGNTMWKGFRHNLLVEDSSNIVIGANLFDRNPDYRPYDSQNTIRLEGVSDATLTGLHLNGTLGEAAIQIVNSEWIHLTDSTILDPAGCGILFENNRHSRIAGNVVRQGGESGSEPFCIRGGDDNLIEEPFTGESHNNSGPR